MQAEDFAQKAFGVYQSVSAGSEGQHNRVLVMVEERVAALSVAGKVLLAGVAAVVFPGKPSVAVFGLVMEPAASVEVYTEDALRQAAPVRPVLPAASVVVESGWVFRVEAVQFVFRQMEEKKQVFVLASQELRETVEGGEELPAGEFAPGLAAGCPDLSEFVLLQVGLRTAFAAVQFSVPVECPVETSAVAGEYVEQMLPEAAFAPEVRVWVKA